MKTKLIIFGLTIAFLSLFVESYAQPGRGLNRSTITRVYDSSKIKTIEGKITKIDTVSTDYTRFASLLIFVKSDKEEHRVYLSPVWFLDDEKINIRKGKKIKITGSHVTYLDKPHIVTKEFEFDEKKIKLRNDDGFPVWAGQRRGPGQGRGRRYR